MTYSEYPFVLGTAGHIDHGKTSLVKALSGVDCDRLTEEKKRGMTIELGFAPLTLPSGRTISVIDVPGHEKFIRQMAAGAAGIDAVMLVVAADDGVMPQTKEHLEILTLLGIQKGIVAINKIDMVDEETLELAEDDIRSLLKGTFLENCPIMPVSALTGKGLDELKDALQLLVDTTKERGKEGPFFLPVDRVFHISGFGTVITGTAFNGSVKDGDELEILPSQTISKVRSIQVHGNQTQTARAGQRVAINLSGLSLEEIKRGNVLAAKDVFHPTDCLDVCINVLSSFPEPIEHRQRLRLHIGTSDVIARISLLNKDKVMPGEEALAQLFIEEPIAASQSSRFILRTYSPLRTIAGGRVLLSKAERPKNKETKQALLKYLDVLSHDASPRESLLALINYKGILSVKDAVTYLESDISALRSHISSLEMKENIGVLKSNDTFLLSLQKIESLKELLSCNLMEFHKTHPERKGMGIEEAAQSMSFADIKLFKELIGLFVKKSWIKTDDERIRMPDFEPFDESSFLASVDSLRRLAKTKGYSMPTIDEATSHLKSGAQEMKRILSYLKERGEVFIIGDEMLLFIDLEDDFKTKLKKIDGDITLASVRDITESSRKYILPLLEYFDSKGITRRVGDKRIMLKK